MHQRVDKTALNEFNRQSVMNVIRNHTAISRSEVSDITGLSIPTIMKIADSFLEVGLLREIGKRQSTGGKPAVLLEFLPDSYFCVGIDIGTNKILGIMMDCAANIIYRYSIPNDIEATNEVFMDKVAMVIEHVLEHSGKTMDKVLGIGVGISGLVRTEDHKVVFSPILQRKDFNLYSFLCERFQSLVLLDNISRVMALGEKYFGHCCTCDNFLFVNLGYGIGSSMCMNGEIYNGSKGYFGEVGHMIVNPLGTRCACGNRGCLETIASAIAIVREARYYINAHESTMMEYMIEGDLDKLDAIHVFEAAKQGDKIALDIVMNAIDYLGMGIANMTNILDPEYVVLGGGISLAGNFLLQPLTEAWQKYRMSYSGEHTKLVISKFGDDAAAIGAAAQVFDSLTRKGYKPQKLLMNRV